MTRRVPGEPARLRRPPRRCPICRAPAVANWRPFCSKRCADADLGRWLQGDYRIPVADDEAGADDGPGNEPGDEPGDGGEAERS